MPTEIYGKVQSNFSYFNNFISCFRFLANGATLKDQIGKKVSIVGVVQSIESGGIRIVLKSTDDHRVNIQLSEPVNAPTTGYIEVIGTVTEPDTIRCQEIITFKAQLDGTAQDFDVYGYNMAVVFWNNCKEVYQMS